MYRRHTFEERLLIISRLISGESLEAICKEGKLDKKMVRQWLLRYEKYGEEGLRGTKSFHYSVEEKLKIVEEVTIKGVTLLETCLKYDLNRTTIQSWLRKVRQGQSLENKRRGRIPNSPMTRPKKKDPQTELEKLKAENLRLKAENALLKKVKALVEEQEARARLNGFKPSTN